MKSRALGVAALLLCLAPAAATASTRWFGFNDNASLTHDLTVDQDARLLARSGANSARITVDWAWVERSEGRLDLSMYDPIYRAWAARGIRPVLIVTGSPEWAWPPWWQWPDFASCTHGEHCHVPPDTAKDGNWAHFVGAVARRYPRAAAIEVWNEPNLRLFFRTGPDPARYTELLSGASAAVKAVRPDMPVLGGSLAAVQGEATDREGWGAQPFLRAMYADGADSVMDGLSLHAYPNGGGAPEILSQVEAVRETRDAAGGSQPLWVTEVGASTGDGYDEFRQSAALAPAVSGLLHAPDVAGVYVHTLVDSSTGDSAERGFGVMRDADHPKRVFGVLQRIFRKSAER